MAEERATELLALSEALQELAKIDPCKSRTVEMRYLGGLSDKETAEALDEAFEEEAPMIRSLKTDPMYVTHYGKTRASLTCCEARV